MGKIKVFLFILCFIPGYLSGGTRDCLKSVYTSQIGIHEEGGINSGPEVLAYIRTTGLNQPVPWCASFLSWCFRLCGVNSPHSAWSPDWFPADHIINPSIEIPQSGDVFGIFFRDKGRIAHVGFIDQWTKGSYFISVEGNTNVAGSREGDGVYRKRRLKSQAYKISRWF